MHASREKELPDRRAHRVGDGAGDTVKAYRLGGALRGNALENDGGAQHHGYREACPVKDPHRGHEPRQRRDEEIRRERGEEDEIAEPEEPDPVVTMNEGSYIDGARDDEHLVQVVHHADVRFRGAQVLEIDGEQDKERVTKEEEEIGERHEIVDARELFHGPNDNHCDGNAILFSFSPDPVSAEDRSACRGRAAPSSRGQPRPQWARSSCSPTPARPAASFYRPANT